MNAWEERIGAAGVAVALMIMVILLPDARRSHVARYLLGFYAGMLSYYLMPLSPASSLPIFVKAALFLLRLAALYFLWRAARATLRDDFEPDNAGSAIGVAALATSVIAILLVNRTEWFAGESARSRELLAGIVPAAWSLAFLYLTVREAFSGWSSDMVDSRRNFRAMLTSAVALAILIIIVLRFSTTVSNARPWTLVLGLLLVFVFSGAFLRAQDELLGRPQRRKYVPDQLLSAKLDAAMEKDFLYREEGMTIRKLANQLNEPEYRLRLHINNGLGFRNFNRFLNSYRIREACSILSNPGLREMTVLRVSLELGFGSISSFNKAFRDVMGMTPTRFRSQSLKEIAAGETG